MSEKKNDRLKKKSAKKEVKKTARTKKAGERLVTIGKKVGKAAGRSFKRSTDVSKSQSRRDKAGIRTSTRSATAKNLVKKGTGQAKSGVKVGKVKNAIVTPKSAHQKRLEQNKGKAAGMSKRWRKAR